MTPRRTAALLALLAPAGAAACGTAPSPLAPLATASTGAATMIGTAESFALPPAPLTTLSGTGSGQQHSAPFPAAGVLHVTVAAPACSHPPRVSVDRLSPTDQSVVATFDWTPPAGTACAAVAFDTTTLPRGSYRLSVRAGDADAVWTATVTTR